MGMNQEYFKVDVRVCSNQLIHLFVILTMGDPFFYTFIHGASEKNARLQLFSQLKLISKGIDMAWVVLGDFYCLANLDERLGQTVRL